MSRRKKCPSCATCKHLGAPMDDKGNRLLGRGATFKFPCLAPFEMPLKPVAYDVRITKNLVTTADGETCPAYKAISGLDKPATAPRTNRKPRVVLIDLTDAPEPSFDTAKPSS